ncbi:MAG TPA: hypothetical protein VNF72_14055, partial [Myxococcota bacterium]|nr:hypothetical protein [Myxococcota bacterium]
MRRAAGVCKLAGLWLALSLAAASAAAVEPNDAAGARDAQRFVAGELIVKLAPGAGVRALDAALAKHRPKRLWRLFSQLEDAQGRLHATASQRAATVRQRFAARVK